MTAKRVFPRLMIYKEEPSIKKDEIQLISSEMANINLGSKGSCMKCAKNFRNNQMIFLNRKGDMYHQDCFAEQQKCST